MHWTSCGWTHLLESSSSSRHMWKTDTFLFYCIYNQQFNQILNGFTTQGNGVNTLWSHCHLSFMTVMCYSPGFLPTYLLPAYEEVVDRPATPPPPYTPLQPAAPPADLPEECPCSHSISILSNADTAPPDTPEATQNHLQSAYNPDKDSTPGRYRRFTGDSGIEVCDDQQLWDQHSYLEREEEREEEGAGRTVHPHGLCEIRNFDHILNNENTAEPQSLR